MPNKLDYSSLDESNPIRLQSENSDLPATNDTAGAVIVTSLILFFTWYFILPIFFAPLIYRKVKKYISSSGASAVRLSNFAIKNNFSYRFGVKLPSNERETVSFGGVVGSNTSEILASNIIEGKYKDFSFKLFNPYQKGLYTIMKVDLKNSYPHIVLDSKDNNPFFSNIGRFFSEKNRIELEGDFGNYFKVYAAAPAVDTLRILSPDMMQIMIDSAHKYDIEIVGNSLHIIANYSFSSSEGVKYFFEVADSLLDKLDRRLATKLAKYDSISRVK